jgi:hypothetical protein
MGFPGTDLGAFNLAQIAMSALQFGIEEGIGQTTKFAPTP